MRIVLFSMPDDIPFFSDGQCRAPSLANALLAGNAPRHEVFSADLTLFRKSVPEAIRRVMKEYRPRLVGLSAMTFQFDTACHTARLIRAEYPEVKIALGGYHATLMYEEVCEGPEGALFDFLIRGEGEHAFAQLADALEDGGKLDAIPGLSFRADGAAIHNPRGKLSEMSTIRIPDRRSRIWQGYRFAAGTFDIIETSRGCTMPCTFCCMQQMYGSNFRAYDLDRVIADISDSVAHGYTTSLLSDDNITLDVPRLIELCKRIRRARLNEKMMFIIQASSRGMCSSEELAHWLARANVRIVFLGIENVSARALQHMGKGDIVEKTRHAVDMLHRQEIIVVAGLITGLPWDGKEELAENYEFAREMNADFIANQIITPYPKTEARRQHLELGLVVNKTDWRWYNGFWANVRTEKLTSDQLLYLRWSMHLKYTRGFMTRSIRRTFPLESLALQGFIWPYKRFRDSLIRWNGTHRDLFEHEMTRFVMQNNFFGDKKPYRPFDEAYGEAPAKGMRPISIPAVKSPSE